MSGAQSSLVAGLSYLIQSGTVTKTLPQRCQRWRSCEQRMGSSPARVGPFAVLKKYQVSPSLAMEGSWTNSTSPSTLMTCGEFGRLSLATPEHGMRRQTARNEVILLRMECSLSRIESYEGLPRRRRRYQKAFTQRQRIWHWR